MAKNPKSVAGAIKAWEHSEDWNVSTVLANFPQGVEIGKHGTKKSLTIKVWSGTEHVGTLSIGQGGVQWSYRKKKYQFLKWQEFAAKMTS